MKIHRALNADSAVKIPVRQYDETNVDATIAKHLDEIFGYNNGDFFIKNSQIRTDMQGRRFKIVLVEDKDMDTHQLYFQLIRP